MSKATVNRPQDAVAIDAAGILSDLRDLLHSARRRVATVANAEQTLLYWRLGKRIRTEVLGGDRAAYGGQIVVSVSRQLEAEFGKGFGEKNVRRMVQFAKVFPDEEIVVSLLQQ
jgi:hypothetical protein